MSDIAITIPAWPFITISVIAGLLMFGCVWWAWRTNGLWRWIACGLAGLWGCVALFFFAGAVVVSG